MDSNIELLKGLGLTMYEAQAYITLTSLISAGAMEISEKSDIPRSKIYNVLKRLHEKNYIEIDYGRPLTYNVKSPVEVLGREKEKINMKIDDGISSLTNIYENGMNHVQAPIWRIYGVDKIINQEIEIIKRAKHTVNMRIGFLFKEEGDRLIDALKNRDELEINILASPVCYIDNDEFNIIPLFEDNNIPIYEADIPFVKMLISDSREMMHIYTKFSDDKRHVIPQTAIGIWNKYEDIAKNYDDRFKSQLRKIKGMK